MATALLAAIATSAIVAPSALAASPSNDDSGNATVLTSFPFQATVDLSQATIQGDEPWCGGHVASVWYRFVAAAEQTLTVSVPASEPSTRICVLPDSIAAGTYRLIQPSETLDMLIDAGRTYFVLLGSVDPSQPATIDLDVSRPYFDLTVTVDPTGIADRVSGGAIVGGTLTCSGPAAVTLSVRIQEKVNSKRSIDTSDNRFDIPCSTATARWQMRLYANTAFVPGVATVSIFAGGGDDVDTFTTTVKLGGK